jgi:hypothetical protein
MKTYRILDAMELPVAETHSWADAVYAAVKHNAALITCESAAGFKTSAWTLDSLRKDGELFDPKDYAENTGKYDRFSTAYDRSINAYCSIKRVNHSTGHALVNFGYQDVLIPLADLSRFVL